MKKRIKEAGVTIKLKFDKNSGAGLFEAHGRKIASVGAGLADDMVLDTIKAARDSAEKDNEKAARFEMQVVFMLAAELKGYLSQSTINIVDEYWNALTNNGEIE